MDARESEDLPLVRAPPVRADPWPRGWARRIPGRAHLGGFSARHPGLLHGRGTIRLRGGDEVTDNELRELIHATLVR